MEKYFVTFEQALVLKELGFDEPCIAFFNGKHHDYKIDDDEGTEVPYINPNMNVGGCLNRPLRSQVFEWFRQKYKLSVVIYDLRDDYEAIIIEWTLDDDKLTHEFSIIFETFEDAESSCIDKLIQLIKQK
jgi:hypothetical protein